MRKHVPLAFLCVAMSTPAFAQSNEELKEEIRELRAEVSELRDLLEEMLQMEELRAQMLSRKLTRNRGRRGRARSKNPRAPTLPGPDAKEPPVAAPPTAAATPRRERGGGVGTISGKVSAPRDAAVAYVFVQNLPGRMERRKRVEIKQYNKQFRPQWAVVRKGTTVAFPNLDDVYHNVFSLSPKNNFDLGLYRKGDKAKQRRFLNTGVVDVYCNIHPKMVASILVVPNKHFTKVKPDGSFLLPDIPAGKRKVVAWAPGSDVAVKWVDVSAGGDANLDLALVKRSSAHSNKYGLPYGSYSQ